MGARPSGAPFPCVVRDLGGQRPRSRRHSSDSYSASSLRVASTKQHLVRGEPVPETAVLSVDLVRGDPSTQHSRDVRSTQHVDSQLWFGREGDLVGHPGGPAAIAVGDHEVGSYNSRSTTPASTRCCVPAWPTNRAGRHPRCRPSKINHAVRRLRPKTTYMVSSVCWAHEESGLTLQRHSACRERLSVS